MEDLKQKLQQLEEQVSAIKNPNLKKVAFEKLLEHSFPKTTGRMPKGNKQKRSSKAKRSVSAYYSEAQIDESVHNLNVTGICAGLPKFRSCKQKIDAYLWVIAYAKKHKVEGLNNHEIAFIMTKRLDKTTKYSTVNGIRRKLKYGLVALDPGTGKWKITDDGEEYLKTLEQ